MILLFRVGVRIRFVVSRLNLVRRHPHHLHHLVNAAPLAFVVQEIWEENVSTRAMRARVVMQLTIVQEGLIINVANQDQVAEVVLLPRVVIGLVINVIMMDRALKIVVITLPTSRVGQDGLM